MTGTTARVEHGQFTTATLPAEFQACLRGLSRTYAAEGLASAGAAGPRVAPMLVGRDLDSPVTAMSCEGRSMWCRRATR
jgi:hypothetical protein